MNNLYSQLQSIPTTHETVSKTKVEELLALNAKQLNGERSRHKSTVAKHDNDFSDIAFSDPATWQLHAFEREHTLSDEQFHIMAAGYENFDMKKYHGYEHIHAIYIYRTIFVVNVMYALSSELYWFAPFDLKPHLRDRINDTYQLKSWDLELAAADFMRYAKWSKPNVIDLDFVKKGNVQVDTRLECFQAFLTALLPYVEKPIEFDIKLSDVLLIGQGD